MARNQTNPGLVLQNRGFCQHQGFAMLASQPGEVPRSQTWKKGRYLFEIADEKRRMDGIFVGFFGSPFFEDPKYLGYSCLNKIFM